MNKIFLLLIFYLASCSNREQKANFEQSLQPTIVAVKDTCVDFNSFNRKVRDGLIRQDSALVEIRKLIPQIKSYFYKKGGKDFSKSDWIFPVQGYTANAIGGTNGSGYISSGYNYFDGNKHGGHPAHDIFIYDSNQDCLDDKTKELVNVLSMTGGIVIAYESDWVTSSDLRGGKYIWIYDPFSNSFFYYGHNNSVSVHQCQLVEPGTVIATIGRTGLNAYKKRSPTHLHFMQLQLDDNYYPRPIDCYEDLKRISKK